MLEDLGADIKMMRKEMGMTQEKLAEKLGIDEKQLSKYENGKVEMGAANYRLLRNMYDEVMLRKQSRFLQQWAKLTSENQGKIADLMEMMGKLNEQHVQ